MTKTISTKILSKKSILGLDEDRIGEDNLDEDILGLDEGHFGEDNHDEDHSWT